MEDMGRLGLGSELSGSDLLENYRSELYRSLPEAANWDPSEIDEIFVNSGKLSVAQNSILLTPQMRCESFIVLLDGTIRVFQNQREGREITLYRVRPGDFCILSLNSLLKNQNFNATACAETPIRALSISKQDFINLSLRHEAFFLRLMESLTDHFSKVLALMEDLAFSRLEQRLASTLQSLCESNGKKVIKVTHLELANELGASREVVSRILKTFENQGRVKLARGKISLDSGKFLGRYENA